MLSIYDFENYKAFTKMWVSQRPNNGRGLFLKMAQHLRVHPTLISQVFKGPKDLTLEQGALLAQFMKLDDRELEYYVSLLERDRAGERALRDLCDSRLKKLKIQAQLIINRVADTNEIPEEYRQQYYSSWEYAAVRVAISIPSCQTREGLVRKLNITATRLDEILSFLLKIRIITEEDQKLKLGPSIIHLKKDAPLISKHHSNWRISAMNRHANLSEDELSFSAPLTISKSDAELIKAMLLKLTEEISKTVKATKPEEVYCLNFDWFRPRQ